MPEYAAKCRETCEIAFLSYQFSHAGTCAYWADARQESFDGQQPFAQPIQWNPSNDEWHMAELIFLFSNMSKKVLTGQASQLIILLQSVKSGCAGRKRRFRKRLPLQRRICGRAVTENHVIRRRHQESIRKRRRFWILLQEELNGQRTCDRHRLRRPVQSADRQRSQRMQCILRSPSLNPDP